MYFWVLRTFYGPKTSLSQGPTVNGLKLKNMLTLAVYLIIGRYHLQQ